MDGLRTTRPSGTIPPMLLTKMGLTGWALANVIASAAFVYFSSLTWLEPELRGQDVARGGDAFVWMLGAFPVLAFSALANAAWFALASRERRREGGVWPIRGITLVAATWVSVLVLDHFGQLGF